MFCKYKIFLVVFASSNLFLLKVQNYKSWLIFNYFFYKFWNDFLSNRWFHFACWVFRKYKRLSVYFCNSKLVFIKNLKLKKKFIDFPTVFFQILEYCFLICSLDCRLDLCLFKVLKMPMFLQFLVVFTSSNLLLLEFESCNGF